MREMRREDRKADTERLGARGYTRVWKSNKNLIKRGYGKEDEGKGKSVV